MSSKRLKMSSSTNAPGQRRVSRGLDDATNKKKQKDRANQESKEGESPQAVLQGAAQQDGFLAPRVGALQPSVAG